MGPWGAVSGEGDGADLKHRFGDSSWGTTGGDNLCGATAALGS